jgi:hypothetical protein
MARITTVGASPGSLWDRDLRLNLPDGDIYKYALLTIRQWQSAEPTADHKIHLRDLESADDEIVDEGDLRTRTYLWSNS